MKIKIILLCLLAVLFANTGKAVEKVLLFVPQDNRPVSLSYTTDTLKYAGYKVIVPPIEYIASRDSEAQVEKLWSWIFENALQADAVVLSNDALIYGGLVASRKHELSKEKLLERLNNYLQLKKYIHNTPIYVFATIMRSPKMSAGGVEPDYYEQYGPKIFAYCAFVDKLAVEGLSQKEKKEMEKIKSEIPEKYLADWLQRREKNLQINQKTIELNKNGVIDYFLLGRDDSWPYSQSGIEKRLLKKTAVGLKEDKFITFNGADQLGLLLLTRAVNNIELKMPTIADFYTEGVGEKTIPSYQDVPIAETVRGQIFAIGALPINDLSRADLIVAVNTPENGITLEAGSILNKEKNISQGLKNYTDKVTGLLKQGKNIAISDIAFANGADNALMHLLSDKELLTKLTAYSGWNTASNTDGYAVAQGFLSIRMAEENKDRIKAVRLLDDWAYQANVRQKVVMPEGATYTRLGKGKEKVEKITNEMLHKFAQENFGNFKVPDFKAMHTWDRMFEVDIELKK